MIPQLLWVLALCVAGGLAWRAIDQGGPWADWLWQGAGMISLALFAAELIRTVPDLREAIAAERIWGPNPVLQGHVLVCVLVVFLRPHRRKAAS